MRKLMWFSIGFLIACVVGAYLTSGMWLLILGGVFFSAFCVLLFVHTTFGRQTACMLLGLVIGLLWFWGFEYFYLKPVWQLDGNTEYLTIEVSEYSRETDYGIAAEGKTRIDGKSYSIQFYINEKIKLAPGDQVEGGFRLRYTGGGAEEPTYHRGNGVFLLGYPKGAQTVTYAESVPVKHFAPMFRQQIVAFLDEIFPKDTSPFAKALLIGDTTGLGYETVSSLKSSGIYHIVAVSGMHVSILFTMICALFLNRRWLIALVGIPLLFLFAAITGFSPSIVRACIMQTLMILALLADKEYDPPTALSAAVLIILTVNPISITSIGLQLSAGCIAGIFLVSDKIYAYFLRKAGVSPIKGKSMKAKLIRWAAGSVSMTLGAMVLTMPMTAFYFESVSVMGVLTNLLTLWLVSIVFYGIIAACVLGALWLPLGYVIGWLISWLARGIIWVSNMVSRIPVSSVYTSSVYIVAWLVFGYILVTVFLKTKKKHPMMLSACMFVSLIGALACSWIEPRLDDYRFTALDVGQGQCLILQSEGKYYMVDCGGDSGDRAADQASQMLFSQGVFQLDGVIITHYDADHAGGIVQVLERIGADKIYLPVLEDENSVRETIAERYSDSVHWVTEELKIALPNGEITIFPSFVTDDDNESSLCVLFQPENCDILITGDRSEEGELDLLESAELPDLDILVAGHHGSRNATSWQLLNETHPEVVVISVGENNSYGHPSKEVLDRLEMFGCDICRTDIEGTIIFRG